jgi:GAF domain-containing protein
MEMRVGADSPTGTGAPATPPTEPAWTPLPGARRLKRYSDREAQREERRLKGRGKAAELLQAAIAAGVDPKLAAVAALVVRRLNVEHCDILQFASDRWVVVVRAKLTDGNAPSPDGPESADSESRVDTADARVELIQIADPTASLDVLRTEGTVDRIHVFISSRQQLTPLGILTVQSSTSLGLSSDERAFLDALGELIGTAIDSHALRTGDELSKTKQLRTQERGSRPRRVERT